MKKTHRNRGRFVVDPAGNWQIYSGTLPENSTLLGTVTYGTDSGALVHVNGKYAQVNDGVIKYLDGRKIGAALGLAGRPLEMKDGKRVNVYLDSVSLDAASSIGNGNVSEGIRRALKR